jgi:hypothetical protein
VTAPSAASQRVPKSAFIFFDRFISHVNDERRVISDSLIIVSGQGRESVTISRVILILEFQDLFFEMRTDHRADTCAMALHESVK